MIIIFSFGFNAVSAADTSQIGVNSSGDNLTDGQMVTDTSSPTSNSLDQPTSTNVSTTSRENGSSDSLNKNIQVVPDPQIYYDGVPVSRGGYPAGHTFSSIASAIAAAQSGDTIMLEGTTFYEHCLVINKNLNFDVFNGQATLDGQNAGYIFLINPGVTVYLQNLILTHGRYSSGGAILNYGKLTLNNVGFYNNHATSNGGAIYNTPNGALSVNYCSFGGNSATCNGGAIFNYGHLGITNSAFAGNVASKDGGVIYNNMGFTLCIDGSSFSSNKGYLGGAIYNSREAPLVLTGCNFTGNIASVDGGAIQNFNGGPLTVTSCSFSGNSAYGGAAIHNTSNVYMTNCNFTSNHATYGAAIDNVDSNKRYKCTINYCNFSGNSASNGGAIFNYICGPLSITGSTFSSNSATNDGGAIVTGTTLIVMGSSFTSNRAVYGGAIYNNNRATFTIKTTNFLNNKASYLGGAIYKNNGNLGIYYSNLSGNRAVYGGAIYKRGGALTVRNNTFSGNISTHNGGGIYKDGGSLTVTGNVFTSNRAAKYGGAIYTKNASTYIHLNQCAGNYAVKGSNLFKA